MRRFTVFLSLVLALGGTAWILFGHRSTEPAWTTVSADALHELELGLDASQKYYAQEALAHFTSALDHDPDFAMAKLMVMLSPFVDRSRRYALRADLAEIDTSLLNHREAFLVRYHLARNSEDDYATGRLEHYLDEYPHDPYALDLRCAAYWEDQDLELAETCYLELLETDPNWVTAQNRLGYLAMGQGELDQAEDRFLTYRYVAPDQANPRDSLGELLIVRGRYDEARHEFDAALEIRPDFCASYANLIDLAFYARDVDALPVVATRIAEQTECLDFARLEGCKAELFGYSLRGDWEQLQTASCMGDMFGLTWLPHFGALMSENPERAHQLSDLYAEVLSGRGQAKDDNSLLLHMRGLEATFERRYEDAVELFYRADAHIDSWGQRRAMLKLYNRAHLAIALGRMGSAKRAEKLVWQIEEVNPPFADAIREGRIASPARE